MANQSSNDPMVTVNQGVLKGKIVTSMFGDKYESFTGIPFAKPPIGNLRFKSPQPAEPWKGVFDATKTAKSCSQFDMMMTRSYSGEEDCLYLNVYVPVGVKKPLPVLFYVHGGGFIAGAGDELTNGGEYFMGKEIIFVAFNYRLGPLGFLCLHTADVPGNAGLKDQLMALKWVSQNISQFGGDTNNITIFGESAGAASVDMMVASPASKGLFHKAITQSGSCLNPWAISLKPVEMAFLLGKILGCETDNIDNLYNFLQNTPVEDLVMASISPEFSKISNIAFPPVVEKVHPGEDAYVSEHPIDIISSGRHNIVPMISGNCSNEGVLFFSRVPNSDPIHLIPHNYIAKLDKENMKNLLEEMQQVYFSEGDIKDNSEKVMGDTMFVKGINDKHELLAKHSDEIYRYVFEYKGNLNLGTALCNLTYKGTSHADDKFYLIRMKMGPWAGDLKINEEDLNIIETLTSMWANFAKYGNPTPKLTDKILTLWSPMTKDAMEYLRIDREIKMVREPHDKQLQLWDKYF